MTPNDLDRKARGLLAAEYEVYGWGPYANDLRNGAAPYGRDEVALRAITAALRLAVPDGWVLVPREATPVMLEAAGRIVFRETGESWTDNSGFAEQLVVEIQGMCYSACIAAAPTPEQQGAPA